MPEGRKTVPSHTTLQFHGQNGIVDIFHSPQAHQWIKGLSPLHNHLQHNFMVQVPCLGILLTREPMFANSTPSEFKKWMYKNNVMGELRKRLFQIYWDVRKFQSNNPDNEQKIPVSHHSGKRLELSIRWFWQNQHLFLAPDAWPAGSDLPLWALLTNDVYYYYYVGVGGSEARTGEGFHVVHQQVVNVSLS